MGAFSSMIANYRKKRRESRPKKDAAFPLLPFLFLSLALLLFVI